jgi:small subunit ribosomal protein S3
MGQKVHPIGMRLGITAKWRSQWYAPRYQIAEFICLDKKIRDFVNTNLHKASIDCILIERMPKYLKVRIKTARPGIIIGKRGEGVDILNSKLYSITNQPIKCEVVEVKKPELSAQIVADSISLQLEKRLSFRRVAIRAARAAIRAGALGIKIRASGRLGGVEMARSDSIREGRVPLQTIRADIKYATSVADTVYGKIGLKVWIFIKEIVN